MLSYFGYFWDISFNACHLRHTHWLIYGDWWNTENLQKPGIGQKPIYRPVACNEIILPQGLSIALSTSGCPWTMHCVMVPANWGTIWILCRELQYYAIDYWCQYMRMLHILHQCTYQTKGLLHCLVPFYIWFALPFILAIRVCFILRVAQFSTI